MMLDKSKTTITPESAQDLMLTRLSKLREDVQLMHPLLDLLKEDEEAIANYGQRIVQLLSSLVDKLESLETQITEDAEQRAKHTARVERLLSLLEAPAP